MKPLSLLALAFACSAFGQRQNPFQPPQAKIQYAPDRTCDLQHVSVDIDVDYPNRSITGTSVNTLKPLRNNIREVLLHAGTGLTLTKVTVNGRTATYKRNGKDLLINTGLLQKGEPIKIAISYTGKNQRGQSFGSGGGWHWIQPNNVNQSPSRVGFWTQGESNYNCEWAPTWDYPNDLATSETRTTVQADWDVIGNGVLVGTKTSADKKRKTYTWRMTQPHATYLLSLVGGPLDIRKDSWEGVELLYTVPKGDAYLIPDSFGHTKDMLSFFSKRLGVKYPWPKYAQNAMYDFGGGMENVSSTTMGEGNLTEARDGYYNMDSLNAHELAHQWFGDLVTCYTWGDIWLNESFASFMDPLYFEHSRGLTAYQWEIEDAMFGYFAEARRYKRPLSTRLYSDYDAVFDGHAYPKGAAILHTLRRQVGDEVFFTSINHYLRKWRHTPVESAQLRRSFAEATGVNTEAFWAQWIEKPGHPVLDYTWEAKDGGTVVTIKQTQDTSDGTPIYDINAEVGIVTSGKLLFIPVRLNAPTQTVTIPHPAQAVILDPNHSFLREIPKLNWSEAELPYILRLAPHPADRQEALRRLVEKPTDENVRLVTQALSTDMGVTPVFRTVTSLVNLAKPELRSFWTAQLASKNVGRRASAVQALGKLPEDAATTATLRSMVNDKEFIQVVINSINALAAWDAKANADVFRKAQGIKDRRSRIKRAADSALEKAK